MKWVTLTNAAMGDGSRMRTMLTILLVLACAGTGGNTEAATPRPSFAGEIESIGAESKTVVVAAARTVTSNLTIPANIHLQFLASGRLEIAEGATVTINGPLDAPLQPIFAGSGVATFGLENTAVACVYPQWWGARGDDKHDDTAAIQAALNAARDMGGGEVVITKGTFKTTGTLHVWGVEKHDRSSLATRSIQVRGVSRRSSVIHYTGDGICMWLCTDEDVGGRDSYHSAAVVQLLHLKGTERSGIGLLLAGTGAGGTGGSAIVENNCIEGFDVGLQVGHSYGSRFSHNKIRYNNTGLQIGDAGGTGGGGATVNGNSFRDNEFSHNRNIGVRIYIGGYNLFEGGLIECNGDEGIYIERAANNIWSHHVTFRNIWIEGNQLGKPAANLGQVYLHSTEGGGYDALSGITFESCFFNCPGENFHIRLGNTIGLRLIYNGFSHPNTQLIYRMPGTHSEWATIRTYNEDQNAIIKGVLAPSSADPGDQDRDNVVGSAYKPHVYYPANSSRRLLTSSIEADARTHSSIASASGVFTTQHTIGGKQGAAEGATTQKMALPRGTALIGLSVSSGSELDADTTVSLEINGRPTSLKIVLPKGSDAKYRSFGLDDYLSSNDWVSGDDETVTFVCDAGAAASTDLHIVAFWRSNHMPVF